MTLRVAADRVTSPEAPLGSSRLDFAGWTTAGR